MNEEQPKVESENNEGVVSTLPKSLSSAYRDKMGRLLNLSEKQKKNLKKWLKNRIREWKEDTQDLHKRLEEDNELVECVKYETDFPWSDASNVHIDVTGIYMDTFEGVEERSILGADKIWQAETDVDELRDSLADIEDALNYKARNEWNIEKCLKEVFFKTNRDKKGYVQATWCEDYKKVNDIAIISNEEEFLNEFPSAEESGLSQEEYDEQRAASRQASPESPLEIPITYEKQQYFGVKGEVVDRIDFVTIPAWVDNIKDERCRGYGKRFTLHRETIRQKGKDKVFYDDEVKELLKKNGNSRGENPYYASKDWIDGVKRTNKKDEYESFELVIKGRLDGENGEEGTYLVTYSEDHDVLLGVMEYYYRVDMYAEFTIGRKSIPDQTRDLNDEIDTQHNQRINIRTITSVPTFKAHNDLKQDPTFDPEAEENKWKPGRIFWSSKPELFDQFKIQPTDLGESLSEETNDMKLLDLRLGSAVSLLSGSVAPGDPNAPGNKTAIMINQTNLRMEKPLNELREGVSELGDICASHYYQFGPPLIHFQRSATDKPGLQAEESASIPKKMLRNGIKMKMKGITVINNPDSEMQRLIVLYQQLMTVPEFQNNPKARVQLWRDALRAGRINNRDKYLPSLEEVQAMQVQLQKQAMMQMAQEKAMAEAKAKAELVENRIKEARRSLEVKSLSERMANAQMGEGPAAPVEAPATNGEVPV